MDIISIIEKLPQIMSYFVPGYVFWACFCFFANKKISTKENLIITSIVASFILTSVSKLICGLVSINIEYASYFSMVLAVVFAIVFIRLYLSNTYKKIANKIGRTTGSGEIWEDLIDRKKGAIVRGYVVFENQEARIQGTVKYYQLLKNGDCAFALWNYTITNDSIDYSEHDKDALFYIKSSEIKGLEIFRGKENG